jgi:hypothetical protein
MTDITPRFDPIPRLQQIAATIEESGAEIFDAPATAVHYIECAIKEIERLRAERDAARREVCTRATIHDATSQESMRRANGLSRCDPEPAFSCKDEVSMLYASHRGWDCFRDEDRKTEEVQG